MKKFLTIILISLVFLLKISASNTDSIPANKGQIGINKLNTLIINQQTNNTNTENNNIKIYPNWWKNITLILILFLLSIFILKFSDEITYISKAFVNQTLASELFQNKNSIFKNILSLFNIISLILISYFLFLYKNKTENLKSDIILIYIFAIIIAFFLAKTILSFIWSISTGEKNSFKIIFFYSKLANTILSFILTTAIFVLLINSNFNTNYFKIIIFIALGIYLIKYFNIFRDFFKQGFSFFYLILYLCTVEILPILIFIRLYLTDFKQI
jgi:hypothetical protein